MKHKSAYSGVESRSACNSDCDSRGSTFHHRLSALYQIRLNLKGLGWKLTLIFTVEVAFTVDVNVTIVGVTIQEQAALTTEGGNCASAGGL